MVFVQSTHLSGGIPDSRVVEKCGDINVCHVRCFVHLCFDFEWCGSGDLI